MLPADPAAAPQSSMDCALKTLRNKGPLTFYTGFSTYCVRIAPHAALTLVFVAWLPRLQAKVRGWREMGRHLAPPPAPSLTMQSILLLLLQVGM